MTSLLKRSFVSVRQWLLPGVTICLAACDKEPTAPGVTAPVIIAFAGRNGAPLTPGNWDIYTIREDGTGLTNLTQSLEDDFFPSWSPDHRLIAFYSMRAPAGVWIMNADGSNPRPLVASQSQKAIAWSPDGRLVFAVFDDSGGRVVIMRPDGTERRTLMPGAMNGLEWSPDGRTILYSRHMFGLQYHIVAISPDGGASRDITPYGTADWWHAGDPAYSPDGSMIAVMRADLDRGLWLMKADGSNLNQITLGEDRRPQWLRADQLLVERTLGARWTLYLVSADGNSEMELVTGMEHSMHPSR